MNSFLIVLKKELSDIFRDKKTIITTILLPIIIYPLMFGLMSFATKDMQKDAKENLSIGVVDTGNSSISKLLNDKGNINIVTDGDLNKKLKDGDISLIIEVPDGFDNDINNQTVSDLKIIFDDSSNKSSITMGILKDIFNEYHSSLVNERIVKAGLDTDFINPFNIKQVAASTDTEEGAGIGSIILNMLPTIIIILLFSPTISIAADLGAGEKERGTLEPLLSTSTNRLSILWGKVASICIVSLVTLVASIAAMGISMKFFIKNMSLSIMPPKALIAIAFFCLLALIALSALNMAVSIYARSMKEANSYLGVLMIPVMMLSYLPFMMDGKSIKFLYFNIPITNSICVMKECIVGIFDFKHIALVTIWNIIYIALALIFTKSMFSKEKVIFRT